MTARWRLRLLGGFELVRVDAAAAQLPRRPTRQMQLLLARLALGGEREHPREELIELLWPGAPSVVARNRLRQALSTLRALLEAGDDRMIAADRHALRLLPGALDTDVDAFVTAVRAGRHEAARALYRGELLPGHFATTGCSKIGGIWAPWPKPCRCTPRAGSDPMTPLQGVRARRCRST